MKKYLLEVGYYDDTVLYELVPKEIKRLQRATVDDIENALETFEVRSLVIDAGYPRIIERLSRKYLIHKLMRRRVPKELL